MVLAARTLYCFCTGWRHSVSNASHWIFLQLCSIQVVDDFVIKINTTIVEDTLYSLFPFRHIFTIFILYFATTTLLQSNTDTLLSFSDTQSADQPDLGSAACPAPVLMSLLNCKNFYLQQFCHQIQTCARNAAYRHVQLN